MDVSIMARQSSILIALSEFFERDLLKVKDEISQYEQENELWEIRPGISNSAGNLTLHIIGNLNHFIGATLGHSGYVRQRDDEFALKNIPRENLLELLDNTIIMIKNSLQGITSSALEKDFPLEKHGKTVSYRTHAYAPLWSPELSSGTNQLPPKDALVRSHINK